LLKRLAEKGQKFDAAQTVLVPKFVAKKSQNNLHFSTING